MYTDTTTGSESMELITADDDGSDSNTQLCKLERETFEHTDTLMSVTLTVHISSCTHHAPNGTIHTTHTQNAYITSRNNTYYTTYTY